MAWIFFTPVQAQNSAKGLKVGVAFAGMNYIGDINPKKEGIHRVYPAANFSLAFESQKAILPTFNAGFGRFDAQNRNLSEVEGIQPNTFVRTQYFYANFLMKIQVLHKLPFHPHAGVGLGIYNFTPKDQNGNPLLNNQSTRKTGESYGSTAFMLPLNLGVQWRLNQYFSITLDYNHFFVFSDYLDNIGQLGSKKGNDKLHGLQLGLNFIWINKAKARRG